MAYDADATRARLVDAAIAEFAERGLAGGRVDRIATTARANKRAIYDYFGNKEGLFDVAVQRVVDDLNAAVPIPGGDLAAYTATLFDYLVAHPEAVRMVTWRRLERPQAGAQLDAATVARVTGVRDSRRRRTGTIGPVDLVVLCIGLANAWSLAGPDLAAAAGDDPDDAAVLARHRAAVVQAATRLAG